MASVGLDQLKELAALAPKKAKTKGQANGASPSGAGDYSTLDVVAWFSAHGHYGKMRPDGKHAVLCPWSHEHSDDQGATDPDTIVWEADGGWAQFHCSHNHCTGRTIQDVMRLWGDVDRYCASTFERAESWPVGLPNGKQVPTGAEEVVSAADIQMPPAFPEVNGKAPKITEGREGQLRAAAAVMRRDAFPQSTIYAALLDLNDKTCDPPLDREAVESIASSIAQFEPSEAQDWRVSAGDHVFVSLDPMRRINTDPPRFEATVLGHTVVLALDDLLQFERFKRAVVHQTNELPALPKPDRPDDKTPEQIRWQKEFVTPALERMNKRGQIEDAPEDAGERGAAWQDVLAFFSKKRHGETRDDIADDRLVLLEDHYYFRGRVLRQWLSDNKLDRLKPDELWDVVRQHGGKSTTIRTKSGVIRVWEIPYVKQDEEAKSDS